MAAYDGEVLVSQEEPPIRMRSGFFGTAAFLVAGAAAFGVIVVASEVRNAALWLVGVSGFLAIVVFGVPALESARGRRDDRKRFVISVPGFLGALAGVAAGLIFANWLGIFR